MFWFFLMEPYVPFTNNQAKGDLRMIKCKHKIQLAFVPLRKAVSFANICPFLSTTSKHSLNLLEVITRALLGDVSFFITSITTS